MAQSKFQTIVDVPKFMTQTGYGKRNLFMGSCFTENVGAKMKALKYQVDINPFGILYNPNSVAQAIDILLKKKEFSDADLVQHNNLWHSFAHHGRFSNAKKNLALKGINQRIEKSSGFLRNTEFLFITFGTAWVYRLKTTGQVVANCHKIPANEFVRERLNVDEIVSEYTQLLNHIWEQNKHLNVVFTVSPIRHWKDGAIENQRSKATLLLAIEKLQAVFGSEKCMYFPSYEIVMDELRDYRFYADDMLHLTDFAVQHIWEIFESKLVDAKSQKTAREILKISNAANHRPINKFTKQHQHFLEKMLQTCVELEANKPYLKLKLEKEYFKVQLYEIEQKR